MAFLTLAACGSPPKRVPPPPRAALNDPWKAAITAQVKPYLTADVVSGLVIGIIDGDRQWSYGFGTAGNGTAAPTATTLFEIGAVTKVYTGVLLADAIERKEVGLSTEVSTLVPLGIPVPIRDDTAITVEHLVSHRSGLPELPPGLSRIPPARYGEDALFADLQRTKLLFTPGQGFLYSDYGVGLLGIALAKKIGAGTWAKAIETRVLAPLELDNTVLAVPAGQSARHAVGHADDGRPVAFAAFGAVDAAAGLRSTVTDQLAFLRANLDAISGKPGPLAAALRRTHDVMIPGTNDQVAMGWFVDSKGRRFHSGHTDGFHAFIEIDLEGRRAVVVLASTGTSLVDKLGDAVMDTLAGEKPAPLKFPTAEEMMPLLGTYKVVGHAATITIELDGNKLIARTADGTRSRLMPVGGPRYFMEKDKAFVTFQGSPATGFVVVTPDSKLIAERIDGTAPPPPSPTPTP